MNSITLTISDKPLYLQIYEAIRAEITGGAITADERLPSKRLLAQNLSVSVNTVDTAYQMLVAEGYATTKPKSGFYACAIPQALSASSIIQPARAQGASTKWRYNFETSSIDTSLFPFKLWCRIQREALMYPQLLNHGERRGDLNFRTAISSHLHEYRGVLCNADSIVVGAGIEYLLCILARLFEGKTIAIEEPGYERAGSVLRSFGASTAYVKVDEAGMSATALSESGAHAAYLTPSCQFPTGVTMPVSRRLELLRWASDKNERYLIEDDFNSEFRFSTRPVPALQGLDNGEHVIYVGTFSKSVAPAIRVAYMVLPPRLLERFNAEFGYFSSTVSRFEQQALCTFISEGHFARHLNRLRTACRKRRDTLIFALQNAFGSAIKISAAQTGLHLIATIQNGMSEEQLISIARAHSINMAGLSSYYHTGAMLGAPSVILGYSALNEKQISQAVAALRLAWATDV